MKLNKFPADIICEKISLEWEYKGENDDVTENAQQDMLFPELELRELERMKCNTFDVYEELNITNFGLAILNRIMKTYSILPVLDIFFNNNESLKNI